MPQRDVRARVEKAATELFAAKGVDGVSIAEIAAAAGVSQGALYRHYRSKDELAWSLFSAAYLRAGADLDAIRASRSAFRARLAAMVAHFCALYDREPALFRFMLIAQHDFLPRLRGDQRTPIEALAETVADAIRGGEIGALDPLAATAAILGIVLQTALFDIYGRLSGPLIARAPCLSCAAFAAVEALAGRDAPERKARAARAD